MKHTFTVLETSIPFHTLVNLVDADDIAKGKIRSHDLTLELNNIQNSFKQKLSILLKTNNLCLHILETLVTKQSLQKSSTHCYKTNRSISACFKKQRDEEDNKEAYSRS